MIHLRQFNFDVSFFQLNNQNVSFIFSDDIIDLLKYVLYFLRYIL